ncbi:MAG: hypothetical protein P4M07_01040 [Xanthobacteraceae bacterium]|nr:hypothetical protein [Xanthobacteraceae bacterium]
MPVSVLSGLARLNLDPWQEAAQLCALPGNRAVDRLAAQISTLPGKMWTHPEAHAAATRLIGLLPSTFTARADTGQPAHRLMATIPFRPWWIFVALVSLVVGSQMIVAHRMSPPADHADTTPAGATSPLRPPMDSDR